MNEKSATMDAEWDGECESDLSLRRGAGPSRSGRFSLQLDRLHLQEYLPSSDRLRGGAISSFMCPV